MTRPPKGQALMKCALKNLGALALTLALSTIAAVTLKEMLRVFRWTAQVKAVGSSSPARRESRLPDAPLRTRLPDAPLMITYLPRPARPTEAIRDRITGVVKLDVLLSARGTVTDIRPREWLPAGLTERAIVAASEIKFRPAVVSGQFTDTWQTIEFKFDAASDRAAMMQKRSGSD